MSYGSWGQARDRDQRSFHEKAFRRAGLAEWDAGWHALSIAARRAFVKDVEGPVKRQDPRTPQPSVAADKFTPAVLKELVEAGFVEVRGAASYPNLKPKVKGKVKVAEAGNRVFAAEKTLDFAARLRTLDRFHPLRPMDLDALKRYVDASFYANEVYSVVNGVIRKAGVDDYLDLSEALKRYITHRRWPGWAAAAAKSPIAERVLAAIVEADGPVVLLDLLARFKAAKPEAVRSAIDHLIAHLAVFEDLDPKTSDIVVGLLPGVAEEIRLADKPRHRPPLAVVDSPAEAGPLGSIVVEDLRAFLLEVASEPARLRQDGLIFAKETGRFLEALGPLAPWLTEALGWSAEIRLDKTFGWAGVLDLVKEEADGKQIHLTLGPKGKKWLSAGLRDQLAGLFDLIRKPATNADAYGPFAWLFYSSVDAFGGGGAGDLRFLGSDLSAIKVGKRKYPPSYWEVKEADRPPLREALDRSLSVLVPDVYYRLDSVLDHAAFGSHNPILLGLKPNEVVVFKGSRKVPPFEEQLEEVGRVMLDGLIRRRLIPLGCLHAAVDAEGRLCVARGPLLDAYFGRKLPDAETLGASAGESKVVVQPDFSVVVIGLNPAPAAELAPFCERATKGVGQGAMVMKLTRQSVVKAVANGMTPADVSERLARLATNGVPPNVAREVKEWAGWVRHVAASTLTVLRCPDREAADRVFSVLKRLAERITDTIVAVDLKSLTPAERAKLKDQGIVIDGNKGLKAAPRVKVKRRRYD